MKIDLTIDVVGPLTGLKDVPSVEITIDDGDVELFREFPVDGFDLRKALNSTLDDYLNGV